MGATALACGHLGRREEVAINLALHPDEPDGGVCGTNSRSGQAWAPRLLFWFHPGTRHTPVYAVSQDWNKTGNQSVPRFSPSQVQDARQSGGLAAGRHQVTERLVIGVFGEQLNMTIGERCDHDARMP